ncbi:hypothetical protein T439DRAFT_381276 [Meredithblackwellia eburnea MCA 4105]
MSTNGFKDYRQSIIGQSTTDPEPLEEQAEPQKLQRRKSSASAKSSKSTKSTKSAKSLAKAETSDQKSVEEKENGRRSSISSRRKSISQEHAEKGAAIDEEQERVTRTLQRRRSTLKTEAGIMVDYSQPKSSSSATPSTNSSAPSASPPLTLSSGGRRSSTTPSAPTSLSTPPGSPRSALKKVSSISSGGEEDYDEYGLGEETPKQNKKSAQALKARFESPPKGSKSRSERELEHRDEDFSSLERRSSRPKPKSKTSEKAARDRWSLTPYDRHYLNKALVCLEIQREWSALSKIGTLTVYGDPFLKHANGPNSRPQNGSKSGGMLSGILGPGEVKRKAGWEGYRWNEGDVLDSPVLRYMYWRFIKNAPVLRDAKREYWTDQIQPLFDSFAERDLSTTKERSEVTKRRLLSMGLTRILGTYYSTCMPALRNSAPARPNRLVMNRIDHLLPGTMESLWRTEFPKGERFAPNAWTAICGMEGDNFVIISRVLVTPQKPEFFVLRSWNKFKILATEMKKADPNNSLGLPSLPTTSPLSLSEAERSKPPPTASLQRYLRVLTIALSTPPSDADEHTLARARMELEGFLLGSPEKLSKREMEEYFDLAEEDDRKREVERREWQKIGERAKELRTTWVLYKKALIERDEVDISIALVRRTPEYKDLPVSHRNAEEWARIWVSYAMHYLFVASPSAKETTHLLKSFHDLIPYAALKLGLMLVNPTLAIKAVVSILLGQPAGQPSLFQRIFSIICGSGIKSAKKSVEELRKKLSNDRLADAISTHVNAPFMQRAATRETAQSASEDILFSIIQEYCGSGDLELVREWHEDFVRRSLAGESQKEDGTGAGKFQTLKSLLRENCLKRDKEQVLELVMEHNTPVFLKTSISVFYDTIWKVANAANLAERLGDLQAFIDDLLEVALSDKKEPSDFIKLSARHDQHLYYLVHELASNGGDLLDPLLDWCKSGLNYIHEGIPIDGERTAERSAVDYDVLLAEAPPETREAVLTEMRDLALVTSYRKAWADISLRADLLAAGDSKLEIDKRALYADLLSQDSTVTSYLETRRGLKGDRPEDSIDWAWFADQDVLDDPSAIKLDWKGAQKSEQEEKEARKQASSKKLFRRNSTSSKASSRSRGEDEENTGFKDLPMPRIMATKTLLQNYVEVVRRDLDAARSAQIK